MAPLTDDHIVSGRSIQLFRHLKHQNMSIISEDIGRARMVQKFQRNGMEQRRNGTEQSTVVLDDRIEIYKQN